MHCERCGKEFVQKVTNQRFCSKACANRRARILPREEACPQCGKTFLKVSSSHKYCCVECKRKAKNERLRKKKAEEEKKARRNVSSGKDVCRECGKTFCTSYSLNHFCSTECRAKFTLRKQAEAEERRKGRKAPDQETCIRCTRPKAEGSDLCEYHIGIRKRRLRHMAEESGKKKAAPL